MVAAIPIPLRLGLRSFQDFMTEFLPSLCPTAISRQMRGIPSKINMMKYGMKNAPTKVNKLYHEVNKKYFSESKGNNISSNNDFMKIITIK